MAGFIKAEEPKDFYGHFLVKYIWNQEAYHASYAANMPRTHPRSTKRVVDADWWNTVYGYWAWLPFSYRYKRSEIKSLDKHYLCTNGNRFRDREIGGAAEVRTSTTDW